MMKGTRSNFELPVLDIKHIVIWYRNNIKSYTLKILDYKRKNNGERYCKNIVKSKRYQGRTMTPPVSPDLLN